MNMVQSLQNRREEKLNRTWEKTDKVKLEEKCIFFVMDEMIIGHLVEFRKPIFDRNKGHLHT